MTPSNTKSRARPCHPDLFRKVVGVVGAIAPVRDDVVGPLFRRLYKGGRERSTVIKCPKELRNSLAGSVAVALVSGSSASPLRCAIALRPITIALASKR